MCWSFEVSAGAYALVCISVVYLWFRNKTPRDRFNAIFLSVFGSMQLIDALLWFIKKSEPLLDCSLKNRLTTRAGSYIICMEPFAALFGRAYAYKNKGITKFELFVYGFVYVFMLFLKNFFIPNCELRYCGYTSANGHIVYGTGQNIDGTQNCWRQYLFFGEYQHEIPLFIRVFFLLGMVYPYLSMKPFSIGLLQCLILTSTWIVGYFSDAHASIWCWANVAQAVTMIIDPFLIREKIPEQEIKRGKYEKINQDFYMKKKLPSKIDTIIIGSGIGGLQTGSLLAKAGKKVVILEQHDRAGGYTHTFELGPDSGYFDTGIHYVGAINIIQQMLDFTCKNPPAFKQMGTKEDNYTYDIFHLDNQKNIEYRATWAEIEKELIANFPEERNAIKKLYWARKKATFVTYWILISKILPKWTPKFIKNIFLSVTESMTKETASEFSKRLFKNEKLRALIEGGQLIDFGTIPNRVSWWVAISMMNYYMLGGYYPVGGSHLMAEGIIKVIEKYGGRVLCKALVKEIIIDKETQQAKGVILENGDVIEADEVISDAGQKNTEKLISKHSNLHEYPKSDPSNSHISAFITLDKNYKEFDIRSANVHSMPALARYNYDFNKMQEDFYKDPFSQKDCVITFTCPSSKDEILADKYPNQTNIVMLSEAKFKWFGFDCGKHLKRTEKYEEFKEKFKTIFLERLYLLFPKSKGHVKNITIGTPMTQLYYVNSPFGASYGTEFTPKRFSSKNMEKLYAYTGINKLYQTGECSYFGGLAGTMVSAWICAYQSLGIFKFLWLLANSEDEHREDPKVSSEKKKQ